jgi:succinate dehydrogenase hydrophobic anchor subunit
MMASRRVFMQKGGTPMFALQFAGAQAMVLGVVVLLVFALTVRRARSSSDRTKLEL